MVVILLSATQISSLAQSDAFLPATDTDLVSDLIGVWDSPSQESASVVESSSVLSVYATWDPQLYQIQRSQLLQEILSAAVDKVLEYSPCHMCDVTINRLKPTGYVMHQQFILLKPTGYVMRQQFNIQQLYVLPTLYLCVLYLSENKQRLVPLTA